MTIDKAIKILSGDMSDIRILEVPDFIGAQNLGIEALKRLRINRINNTFYVHQLLPGETEK